MKEVTLHTRGYDHEAEVWQHRSLIFVRTPYNDEIVDALRSFDRARWHAPDRAWTFPASPRNVWSLQAMTDGSAFERYIEDVPDWMVEGVTRYNAAQARKLDMFQKQREMVAWILKKKQCILAAEMRTGKTWAYIEVMETHPDWVWWYVCPKKVQAEIRNQLKAWGCKVQPRFLNYSELAKVIDSGDICQGIIYDEGSFLKGHSKRALAAIALANRMDAEFGEANTIRVLGTGTPQPHGHLDWWHLCEAVRPGFLPWGNMFHFQQYLEVREKMQGVYGNEFWKRVQWKDGSPCVKCVGAGATMQGLRTCEYCKGTGKTEDHLSRLKEILAGIVLVVYKHEVVELPDKEFVVFAGQMPDQPSKTMRYEIDPDLKPTPAMLNVAKAIAGSGLPAIEVMSKLAQLADGFQYQWDKKVVKGKDGEERIVKKALPTIRGKTPKDKVVKSLLAKHEEVGRFVIYAAYTEAIDHLCQLAEEEGWKVLRCDGKHGWKTWDGRSPEDALAAFADKSFDKKVVAIGHPKSMGYGLDLAASPGFLFYSLNFDGETYMQAVERGHSINMDLLLGCTIYFIEVLPTDGLTRNNVQSKKSVQDITTGDILRVLRSNASKSRQRNEAH
jgi:hypothetical protein